MALVSRAQVRAAQQEKEHCDLFSDVYEHVTEPQLSRKYYLLKSHIYFGIQMYAHLKVNYKKHTSIVMKVTLLARI